MDLEKDQKQVKDKREENIGKSKNIGIHRNKVFFKGAPPVNGKEITCRKLLLM